MDMVLGLMQPYFFPYLGYFDLINCTTKWIIFDTAQYIRRGWINRNRILHPKEGWQYIVVPIQRAKRETAIADIRIKDQTGWKEKILRQLNHYRKNARYFDETISLVTYCLDIEERRISRLNTKVLENMCKYLGISFHYQYLSEMNLELPAIDYPGDWALYLAQAMGAKEYINPSGGRKLYDTQKFEKLGIKLTIRGMEPFEYACRNYRFEPNLSIIDVLMWNSPENVKAYLDTQKNEYQSH
jgi:hypothetical protein